MKYLLISMIILATIPVLSAEKAGLEKKLESLNIPDGRVTPLLSEENLYVVNQRYSSLIKRFEMGLFGAHDFAADSHMDTKQAGISARYHFNSKWSLGAKYTEYYNELTASGEALFEKEQLLPDSDFALKSTEGFISYNTVYGKVRLTKESIVYFDQYISLGYGTMALSKGETHFYSLDLGLAFWLGKNFSSRIGLKNEFFTQQRLNGDDNVHNAMGYIEMGYLFGEGSRI